MLSDGESANILDTLTAFTHAASYNALFAAALK